MSAKWTPGPWCVGGVFDAFSADGNVAMREIQSDHGRIGFAVFRPSMQGDKYRDANARLIAKAPEMYDLDYARA